VRAPAAVVGATAHEAAIGRLVESYRRIPAGSTVRLAKRTSNLFRPRGRPAGPGLDVSGLDGVVAVDTDARTADVQGMCTYEHLVQVTLAHGLMPLVVPQLRTITLGGAVAGLGIESTSFRNGLPHESVLEMDVLTGAGEILCAAPTGEHADLFTAFPNSYGSLGYATRVRIALEEVSPQVALRHLPVRLEDLGEVVAGIVRERSHDGTPVDFVDGVVFSPDEIYLTLGRWADTGTTGSDYTGQDVFFRSLQQRSTDVLSVHDYLWRWDTDWFWCSAAFGAQNRWVRRVWPARWRRSDVYHRLVGLENRYHPYARLQRWRGRPDSERVVQDVEVPAERLADFLGWFDAHVGMRPVWLCPLRLREPDGPGSATTWPLYPLQPGRTYVNVGFWGQVPIAPGAAEGDLNRAVEQAVTDHGGHKSLYSDAYYSREEFDRLYDGSTLNKVRQHYDPGDRLTGLYEKAVRRS
jgi:FAD/FMN-containing dehydrogenase